MSASVVSDYPSSVNLEHYADFSLPTLYQTQMHLTKYARWNPELGRRETWPETVYRYTSHMRHHLKNRVNYALEPELEVQLYEAILQHRAMPSMRALMTAGRALVKDEISSFNCCYLQVNRVKAFDEVLYLLACGCGVGFSVERQYIKQLPDLPEELFPTDTVIVVADSKIGWAIALRQLLNTLYNGNIPKWDTAKVRPAGAPLKTFGGRASGAGVLIALFKFVISVFQEAVEANQTKLDSIQCHSIMTKIGDCIVSGGVRRSALLSLSNPSDSRMRNAKTGRWWETDPHFRLANNSAAWTDRPNAEIFLEEWLSLIKSKSGERGIFNRKAASIAAGKSGRRKTEGIEFGLNPCSEIILRDRECCNLSEVVIRHDDTLETLKEKVRLAAILGTFQSTFTNFRYLSGRWRENLEEERLLGVSLTGIYDCRLLNDPSDPNLPELLHVLREEAVETNRIWAERFGINQSVAATTVKPSGNCSALVNSASGIHPRHSPFYIRTNRGNKIDPVAQLMRDAGIPYEDDVSSPHTAWVFSFPLAAPEGAVCRGDVSALDHLALWKIYQEHYTEHKPSITVSVRDHEWLAVGAFVLDHWDLMTGVSFLPYSDHIYHQAPYQEATREEYEALLQKMPQEVDWSQISRYETEDQTTSARELACVAGQCELTD